MSRLTELRADCYRIPLPVPVSDSTHGTIEAFQLITARLRDDDGSEGLGFTFSFGQGGLVIIEDGVILGGIGVGGYPSGQADEDISRIGLNAMNL